MFQLKNKTVRASVAVFTAVCLSFTQAAISAPIFSASAPAEVSLPDSLRLDRAVALKVPSAIATIEKLQPGNGKTIFHIQTAHGHYQAQQNINLLLKDLEKNYGVKTVLVEGSSNPLNPEIINFFPKDHEKTMRVVDLLTRKAILKGSEIYLLESGKARGFGIEDEVAYNQNLQDFALVIRAREESKQFLDNLEQSIERLSAVYLSTNLRSFLKQVERKETGNIPFDAYLQQLKIAAKKYAEIDLADPAWQLLWPMLTRVFTIEKLEKKIDAVQFDQQKKDFLTAIKPYTAVEIPREWAKNSPEVAQRVSVYEEVKSLLDLKDLSAKLPDPDTSILFENLVKSLPANFNYARFSSVTSFCGILMIKSEIKADVLTAEISKMEDQITDKLAEKKTAKELVAVLKDYRMLQKLFSLELAPSDYEVIAGSETGGRRPESIQPSVLANRLQTLGASASSLPAKQVRGVKFNHVKELDSLFNQALKFYAGARLRDGKMLARIEERLKETHADKVAVITGGFHSEPFAKYFEQRGYNYALMTPKITTVDAEGRNDYLNAMMMLATAQRLQARRLEARGPRTESATIEGKSVAAMDAVELSLLAKPVSEIVRSEPSLSVEATAVRALWSTEKSSLHSASSSASSTTRATARVEITGARSEMRVSEFPKLGEIPLEVDASQAEKQVFIGKEEWLGDRENLQPIFIQGRGYLAIIVTGPGKWKDNVITSFFISYDAGGKINNVVSLPGGSFHAKSKQIDVKVSVIDEFATATDVQLWVTLKNRKARIFRIKEDKGGEFALYKALKALITSQKRTVSVADGNAGIKKAKSQIVDALKNLESNPTYQQAQRLSHSKTAPKQRSERVITDYQRTVRGLALLPSRSEARKFSDVARFVVGKFVNAVMITGLAVAEIVRITFLSFLMLSFAYVARERAQGPNKTPLQNNEAVRGNVVNLEIIGRHRSEMRPFIHPERISNDLDLLTAVQASREYQSLDKGDEFFVSFYLGHDLVGWIRARREKGEQPWLSSYNRRNDPEHKMIGSMARDAEEKYVSGGNQINELINLMHEESVARKPHIYLSDEHPLVRYSKKRQAIVTKTIARLQSAEAGLLALKAQLDRSVDARQPEPEKFDQERFNSAATERLVQKFIQPAIENLKLGKLSDAWKLIQTAIGLMNDTNGLESGDGLRVIQLLRATRNAISIFADKYGEIVLEADMRAETAEARSEVRTVTLRVLTAAIMGFAFSAIAEQKPVAPPVLRAATDTDPQLLRKIEAVLRQPMPTGNSAGAIQSRKNLETAKEAALKELAGISNPSALYGLLAALLGDKNHPASLKALVAETLKKGLEAPQSSSTVNAVLKILFQIAKDKNNPNRTQAIGVLSQAAEKQRAVIGEFGMREVRLIIDGADKEAAAKRNLLIAEQEKIIRAVNPADKEAWEKRKNALLVLRGFVEDPAFTPGDRSNILKLVVGYLISAPDAVDQQKGKDQNGPWAKVAAAQVLESIGGNEARDALNQFVTDPAQDPKVKADDAFQKVLKKFSGRSEMRTPEITNVRFVLPSKIQGNQVRSAAAYAVEEGLLTGTESWWQEIHTRGNLDLTQRILNDSPKFSYEELSRFARALPPATAYVVVVRKGDFEQAKEFLSIKRPMIFLVEDKADEEGLRNLAIKQSVAHLVSVAYVSDWKKENVASLVREELDRVDGRDLVPRLDRVNIYLSGHLLDSTNEGNARAMLADKGGLLRERVGSLARYYRLYGGQIKSPLKSWADFDVAAGKNSLEIIRSESRATVTEIEFTGEVLVPWRIELKLKDGKSVELKLNQENKAAAKKMFAQSLPIRPLVYTINDASSGTNFGSIQMNLNENPKDLTEKNQISDIRIVKDSVAVSGNNTLVKEVKAWLESFEKEKQAFEGKSLKLSPFQVDDIPLETKFHPVTHSLISARLNFRGNNPVQVGLEADSASLVAMSSAGAEPRETRITFDVTVRKPLTLPQPVGKIHATARVSTNGFTLDEVRKTQTNPAAVDAQGIVSTAAAWLATEDLSESNPRLQPAPARSEVRGDATQPVGGNLFTRPMPRRDALKTAGLLGLISALGRTHVIGATGDVWFGDSNSANLAYTSEQFVNTADGRTFWIFVAKQNIQFQTKPDLQNAAWSPLSGTLADGNVAVIELPKSANGKTGFGRVARATTPSQNQRQAITQLSNSKPLPSEVQTILNSKAYAGKKVTVVQRSEVRGTVFQIVDAFEVSKTEANSESGAYAGPYLLPFLERMPERFKFYKALPQSINFVHPMDETDIGAVNFFASINTASKVDTSSLGAVKARRFKFEDEFVGKEMLFVYDTTAQEIHSIFALDSRNRIVGGIMFKKLPSDILKPERPFPLDPIMTQALDHAGESRVPAKIKYSPQTKDLEIEFNTVAEPEQQVGPSLPDAILKFNSGYEGFTDKPIDSADGAHEFTFDTIAIAAQGLDELIESIAQLEGNEGVSSVYERIKAPQGRISLIFDSKNNLLAIQSGAAGAKARDAIVFEKKSGAISEVVARSSAMAQTLTVLPTVPAPIKGLFGFSGKDHWITFTARSEARSQTGGAVRNEWKISTKGRFSAISPTGKMISLGERSPFERVVEKRVIGDKLIVVTQDPNQKNLRVFNREGKALQLGEFNVIYAFKEYRVVGGDRLIVRMRDAGSLFIYDLADGSQIPLDGHPAIRDSGSILTNEMDVRGNTVYALHDGSWYGYSIRTGKLVRDGHPTKRGTAYIPTGLDIACYGVIAAMIAIGSLLIPLAHPNGVNFAATLAQIVSRSEARLYTNHGGNEPLKQFQEDVQAGKISRGSWLEVRLSRIAAVQKGQFEGFENGQLILKDSRFNPPAMNEHFNLKEIEAIVVRGQYEHYFNIGKSLAIFLIPLFLSFVIAYKYNLHRMGMAVSATIAVVASFILSRFLPASAPVEVVAVAEKIKDIIAKRLGANPEVVTEDAQLVEGLNADSLDLIELINKIESQFKIDISDAEAERLATVGDYIQLVQKKLARSEAREDYRPQKPGEEKPAPGMFGQTRVFGRSEMREILAAFPTESPTHVDFERLFAAYLSDVYTAWKIDGDDIKDKADRAYVKQMALQHLRQRFLGTGTVDPNGPKAPLHIRRNKGSLNVVSAEGNAVVTSQLTYNELREAGAYKRSDLDTDPRRDEYLKAASGAWVTWNTLDGGIGESLMREEWLLNKGLRMRLKDILSQAEQADTKYQGPLAALKQAEENGETEEIIKALREIEKLAGYADPLQLKMGAKGTDLGRSETIRGNQYFVGDAERRLLLIADIATKRKFGKIAFQPFVNYQSAESYVNLMQQPYLWDVIEGSEHPRTYQQALEDAGVEIKTPLEQQDLPKFEIEDGAKAGLPTLDSKVQDKGQPGGHGQWGAFYMMDFTEIAPPDNGFHNVRFFGNGDNNHGNPEPIVVGFAIVQKKPILKITTPATAIDTKGGKETLRLIQLKERVTRVLDQWEEIGAKNAGQIDLFYKAGQRGGFGEQGRQHFNTNLFVFDEEQMHPILRKMREIVGEDEFLDAVMPLLFDKSDKAKTIDGKKFVSMDSAIGYVIHNLNTFYSTDPRLEELRREYGPQLLYYMDYDRGIFAPKKKAEDQYLQERTDYYGPFDEEAKNFHDAEPGLTPPGFDVTDPVEKDSKKADSKFWGEVQHWNDSFGISRVRKMQSLKVEGRVTIRNAEYVGDVVIINRFGREDKTKPAKRVILSNGVYFEQLKALGYWAEDHLLLENVTITIDESGILSTKPTRSEIRNLDELLAELNKAVRAPLNYRGADAMPPTTTLVALAPNLNVVIQVRDGVGTSRTVLTYTLGARELETRNVLPGGRNAQSFPIGGVASYTVNFQLPAADDAKVVADALKRGLPQFVTGDFNVVPAGNSGSIAITFTPKRTQRTELIEAAIPQVMEAIYQLARSRGRKVVDYQLVGYSGIVSKQTYGAMDRFPVTFSAETEQIRQVVRAALDKILDHYADGRVESIEVKLQDDALTTSETPSIAIVLKTRSELRDLKSEPILLGKFTPFLIAGETEDPLAITPQLDESKQAVGNLQFRKVHLGNLSATAIEEIRDALGQSGLDRGHQAFFESNASGLEKVDAVIRSDGLLTALIGKQAGHGAVTHIEFAVPLVYVGEYTVRLGYPSHGTLTIPIASVVKIDTAGGIINIVAIEPVTSAARSELRLQLADNTNPQVRAIVKPSLVKARVTTPDQFNVPIAAGQSIADSVQSFVSTNYGHQNLNDLLANTGSTGIKVTFLNSKKGILFSTELHSDPSPAGRGTQYTVLNSFGTRKPNMITSVLIEVVRSELREQVSQRQSSVETLSEILLDFKAGILPYNELVDLLKGSPAQVLLDAAKAAGIDLKLPGSIDNSTEDVLSALFPVDLNEAITINVPKITVRVNNEKPTSKNITGAVIQSAETVIAMKKQAPQALIAHLRALSEREFLDLAISDKPGAESKFDSALKQFLGSAAAGVPSLEERKILFGKIRLHTKASLAAFVKDQGGAVAIMLTGHNDEIFTSLQGGFRFKVKGAKGKALSGKAFFAMPVVSVGAAKVMANIRGVDVSIANSAIPTYFKALDMQVNRDSDGAFVFSAIAQLLQAIFNAQYIGTMA